MSWFKEDIKDSSKIARIVAPKLKELFMQVPDLFTDNNIYIYDVENQQNKLLKLLDKDCGIDYFVTNENDKRTIGLAWRALRCKKPIYQNRGVYNSFSVRVKRNTSISEEHNEINKRKDAIKNNLVYPQFTAQAHYDPDDNTLLSLAIARTSDVYNALENNLFRVCDPNHTDKEVYFLDVQWFKMKEHGYKVYDWYKDEACKRTYMNEV